VNIIILLIRFHTSTGITKDGKRRLVPFSRATVAGLSVRGVATGSGYY